MTRKEQIAAVDAAKQEILNLRKSNAELLAALKETITPLILLGDYIGNEWEGKIGISAFDRCAVIGKVRAAIAKAEGRS